jgi:hypothetical protein
VSDAPRRTAIRWMLARLNAIHIDCPSMVILDAPDVSTPVSVLEIGFKRTWLPGVKRAVPVDSKPGLAVEFLRTEETHFFFPSLDVCPCFNINGTDYGWSTTP